MTARPALRIDIDRLVLDGLDPRDEAAVARAVELEVARCVHEPGVPEAVGSRVARAAQEGGR